MAYPATPKTWVAGDVLTAAQLNAELRDALLGAFPLGVGAWTTYTPTLGQGATGNIAKNITYARYQRIGRTIHYQAELSVTGTGTAAAGISVTLPVAAVRNSSHGPIGVFWAYDQSAGVIYTGAARCFGTLVDGVASGLGQLGIGALPNFALASPDVVALDVTYEATS